MTFTDYGECEVTTDVVKDRKVVNSYTNTYYGVVDKFTCPSDPQLGRTYEFEWEYWSPDTPESFVSFWQKPLHGRPIPAADMSKWQAIVRKPRLVQPLFG